MPYLDNIPDDRSKLIYNGIDLRQYGLYVSGDKTFNSPKKEYTKVSIPGRSGDLVIFNGRYSNVPLEYDAILIENYEENAAALRSVLLSPEGYVRIEDGYHPNEYRMGVFEGPVDFDTILLAAGSCTLQFNCQPYRWLKDGENEIKIESPQTVVNNTMFDSKPLFRVNGNGKIECAIENVSTRQSFTIDFGTNEHDMDCFVDSETMNCYKEGYDDASEKGETVVQTADYGTHSGYSNHKIFVTSRVTHNDPVSDEIESATLRCDIFIRCYDYELGDTGGYIESHPIVEETATHSLSVVPGDGMPSSDTGTIAIDRFDTEESGGWGGFLTCDFLYRKNTIHPTTFTYTFYNQHFGTIPITSSFVPVSKGIITANEFLTIDEFPVLHPGKSVITVTGDNVQEVLMTPRWFIV